MALSCKLTSSERMNSFGRDKTVKFLHEKIHSFERSVWDELCIMLLGQLFLNYAGKVFLNVCFIFCLILDRTEPQISPRGTWLAGRVFLLGPLFMLLLNITGKILNDNTSIYY